MTYDPKDPAPKNIIQRIAWWLKDADGDFGKAERWSKQKGFEWNVSKAARVARLTQTRADSLEWLENRFEWVQDQLLRQVESFVTEAEDRKADAFQNQAKQQHEFNKLYAERHGLSMPEPPEDLGDAPHKKLRHDSGRYCHLIAERLAVLVQMNGPLNIGQPPEKDYGDWWTRFKRQMDGVKVTAGSEATPVFQQQNVAELKGVIMDTAAMIATVEKRKNPDFSIGDAADRVEQFFYETTKIDKFQDWSEGKKRLLDMKKEFAERYFGGLHNAPNWQSYNMEHGKMLPTMMEYGLLDDGKGDVPAKLLSQGRGESGDQTMFYFEQPFPQGAYGSRKSPQVIDVEGVSVEDMPPRQVEPRVLELASDAPAPDAPAPRRRPPTEYKQATVRRAPASAAEEGERGGMTPESRGDDMRMLRAAHRRAREDINNPDGKRGR